MRIALGVSGGIAAYKAAELVRLFQERGLDVQVVMTRNACEFVRPLTFAALTGHQVIAQMFGGPGDEPNLESAIEHVAVAQAIDALVIAPATADLLAKLAHGMADDFLTTLALATQAPTVVAPAMNVNMWENAGTQENIASLRARGIRVIEPDAGYLACGMTGSGRLASLDVIVSTVLETLGISEDLKGEIVLVTAGRTEEPLDAVRYLGNRSSGRMGYAVAEASLRRGARVILVSGPTHLEPPAGAEIEQARTTEQMAEAVFKHLEGATIVVMTAAVADFRPAEVELGKIKRGNGVRTLALEPTPDILAEIARRRQPGQLIVGFAAETDHLVENATAKLRQKALDLVVANDVTQEGAGFDVDTNIVTLVRTEGPAEALPKMSKLEVAHRILDEVAALRALRRVAPVREFSH